MGNAEATARQLEVYEIFVGWVESEGYTPTLDQLNRALAITSGSAMRRHIAALVKKGYLERISTPTGGPRWRPTGYRFKRVEFEP